MSSWSATDSGAFWRNSHEARATACRNWEGRSQLPIFRAKLDLGDNGDGDGYGDGYGDGDGDDDDDDEISSALLVVSRLKSFRASFDGVPLSSSGPDPPLMDVPCSKGDVILLIPI